MRALVLNANSEPLHICDARRAMVLVLEGIADTVLESGDVVHSQLQEFPLPSIIALRQYIKVPRGGKSIPVITRTVLARDNHICAYCLSPTADTLDHIIPRAHGGKKVWENVVAACRRCNHKKRDRTPEQAKMPLLRQPSTPRGAHARLLLYAMNDDWIPYLLDKVA